MTETEIQSCLDYLRKSDTEFIGFHGHLGGSIMNEDIDIFCQHANHMIERSQAYVGMEDIQVINLGGGLGIPQKEGEDRVNIKRLSKKLDEVLVDQKSIDYVIEPGRYISGPSTVLLTEVRSIREYNHKRFVGVDAGMSQFPRTTMFDVYHEISNLTSSGTSVPQTVAGPTCSGADIFCSNREFDKSRKGDILAIEDVGAYGFVMAGNFHAYPYPTIVSSEGEESPISGGFGIKDLQASDI